MGIHKVVMLAGALALGAMPALAQQKGGVINVATVGEPPTLDPMASTADLVGIITQHFYETLFTFDKNWKVTPLLAESLPEVSEDGKVYTIKLRQGVTFHDGSAMTSEDVLASLKRWTEVASRGKQTGTYIEKMEALDPSTVRITLKVPYAPLFGAAVVQQRRGGHHAVGEDGEPLQGARRNGSLQAEGAQTRPVYPARPLRRLQVPRRRAGRLWRRAQAVPRRDQVRAGARSEHPDRRRDFRPVRLCRCAARRSLRPAEGPEGDAARPHEALRVARLRPQHQRRPDVEPRRPHGRAHGAEHGRHDDGRLRQP